MKDSRNLREQLLVAPLRKTISSLPQSTFVDAIIEFSEGQEREISLARESLLHVARDKEDCPRGRAIGRQKTARVSEETYLKRLSLDCYKLIQFIEGGPVSDVQDIFRACSQLHSTLSEPNMGGGPTEFQPNSVSKSYQLHADGLADLRAALHLALERITALENDVKSLREKQGRMKAGFILKKGMSKRQITQRKRKLETVFRRWRRPLMV